MQLRLLCAFHDRCVESPLRTKDIDGEILFLHMSRSKAQTFFTVFENGIYTPRSRSVFSFLFRKILRAWILRSACAVMMRIAIKVHIRLYQTGEDSRNLFFAFSSDSKIRFSFSIAEHERRFRLQLP